MKKSNIIIEGNKLIAEYMGYFHKSIEYAKRKKIKYDWKKDMVEIRALNYHKSWESLMPVVIKIESTKDMSVRVQISGYICEIYQTKRNPAIKENGGFQDISLVSEKHNDKLTLVWMSVIEFIKWYNQ
jgi:outer membrane phospholipase A